MRSSHTASGALLSCLALFLGCLGQNAEAPPPAATPSGRAVAEARPTEPQAPTNEREKEIVDGNNAFAVGLYRRLLTGDGNLFFSPYSLREALALAFGGARGETATEMANALHFPADPAALHPALAALRSRLAADRAHAGYELSIANALWGQRGLRFAPAFLNLAREQYGGAFRETDFRSASESARAAINAWVEEATHKKIVDLIPSGAIDAQTRLVLANAIYFKGDWTRPFNEKSTREAPFKLLGGGEKPVALMHEEALVGYKADATLQTLELTYAGDALAMIMLLPKAADGLPALEQSLTAEALQSWTSDLRRREVQIYLPKFRMTSQFSLAGTLAAMGMTRAFSDRADFSGISSEEPLAISAVLHKAFVEVTERGTEAAAATAVGMRPTSAPLQPLVFRADHPFIFLIRDRASGTILFLGRLTRPE